jgi:hypothetical protein
MVDVHNEDFAIYSLQVNIFRLQTRNDGMESSSEIRNYTFRIRNRNTNDETATFVTYVIMLFPVRTTEINKCGK